jgi:ribosomal protein L37AE/L43A
MKAFKDVAKSVGIGLIVFTIEQIIVFAISQLITGSALQWWQRFDFVTVIIIGGTTGGAVAVALTLYRLRQIKKINNLQYLIKDPEAYPYQRPDYPHKGVYWEVWATRKRPRKGDSLRVRAAPKCPECRREMEENKTFWGKFSWTCIKCGFKLINEDSSAKESERVEKLAEADLEHQGTT